MNASDDNAAPKGLRGRWASPPRSGMQRIIAPWEYRHLRFWAGVRIGAGIVLAGLGAVTLVGGSFTTGAVGWPMLFLSAAAGTFPWAPSRLPLPRSPSTPP